MPMIAMIMRAMLPTGPRVVDESSVFVRTAPTNLYEAHIAIRERYPFSLGDASYTYGEVGSNGSFSLRFRHGNDESSPDTTVQLTVIEERDSQLNPQTANTTGANNMPEATQEQAQETATTNPPTTASDSVVTTATKKTRTIKVEISGSFNGLRVKIDGLGLKDFPAWRTGQRTVDGRFSHSITSYAIAAALAGTDYPLEQGTALSRAQELADSMLEDIRNYLARARKVKIVRQLTITEKEGT